ncbi:MAG: hypothetical protein L6408_06510 [Nanoarchaeota archaeon]|nr:hypothetical protein [Nanoarchaeota archaeon]
MNREMSDSAWKLAMLLLRWRCIGGRYRPIEKLMKALKFSGGEFNDAVKELANNGFIIFHRKDGKNIPSLNPHKVKQIRMIEKL